MFKQPSIRPVGQCFGGARVFCDGGEREFQSDPGRVRTDPASPMNSLPSCPPR